MLQTLPLYEHNWICTTAFFKIFVFFAFNVSVLKLPPRNAIHVLFQCTMSASVILTAVSSDNIFVIAPTITKSVMFRCSSLPRLRRWPLETWCVKTLWASERCEVTISSEKDEKQRCCYWYQRENSKCKPLVYDLANSSPDNAAASCLIYAKFLKC